MKKVFKIYPALLVLTPHQETEPVVVNGIQWRDKINRDSNDNYFSNGHPYTYTGNCLFNAGHTIVSIRFGSEGISCSSIVNLPGSLFTALEPTIWMGTNYTLTFIEVPN